MIKRYTLPEMGEVWTEENKYATWLKVEILACEAWARLGKIPQTSLRNIKRKASLNVRRILKIEERVHHDLIAFLSAVSESVGRDSRYIHMGLSSYDIEDTALSLRMRDAADIILEDLEKLIAVLGKKAKRYKRTPMVGRTHGVHAEPTTFGLKLAGWLTEMERNLDRMRKARETVSYGKLSGAVGNYAHCPPSIEKLVCQRLNLKPARVSTQILQRDRHADYLCTLALIASSLDKFATEIRNLQRTEVLEVEEPFAKGQKGSSAMPHKRNPITCERISGLARVVRGNAQAGLENMPLWHERDITHSSVERIILPDSNILLDYMLNKFTQVVDNLIVYPENMKRNLEKSKGLIFSQRVLLELINKGLSREEAYALVQRNAMKAWKGKGEFRELLLKDKGVKKVLREKEIEKCFDLNYYLRNVDKIFVRLRL